MTIICCILGLTPLFLFFSDKKYGSEPQPQGDDKCIPTKEKIIANLTVHVSEPKEEALEVQPQSSLPDEVVRSCLICGKKLLGKSALSRHLKQKHGHGSFTCEFCEQVFTSGCKLHEHARLKKHNAFMLPPQMYALCGILPFIKHKNHVSDIKMQFKILFDKWNEVNVGFKTVKDITVFMVPKNEGTLTNNRIKLAVLRKEGSTLKFQYIYIVTFLSSPFGPRF